MAKRKQSSQSVRQSAKRREEEAKRRRNSQIRTAAFVIFGIVIVLALAYLLVRPGDETESETARSSDSPAERETASVEQAVAAPIESDEAEQPISSSEVAEPGPLAAIAPADRYGYYQQAPAMVIDSDKEYEALVRTEKGDIRLRLFAEESPATVNNFVFLAREGYYDGTIFHRVIQDFMAQAGDPTGTGGGDPGYMFEDEVDSGLEFDRPGLLAMANRGPNTNGSQFFITYSPTPHLNGLHTIFGEIAEGEDVLNSLSRVQPGQGQGDVIERIVIIES